MLKINILNSNENVEKILIQIFNYQTKSNKKEFKSPTVHIGFTSEKKSRDEFQISQKIYDFDLFKL